MQPEVIMRVACKVWRGNVSVLITVVYSSGTGTAATVASRYLRLLPAHSQLQLAKLQLLLPLQLPPTLISSLDISATLNCRTALPCPGS
jgi:hypothetical protein